MNDHSVAAAYPSLRSARYAQYLLAFVTLYTTMDVGVGKLLLEPMKVDLGMSDVEVGFANVTANYLTYGLLAIPAGLLADRYSRVRLMLLSLLLWTVGLIAVGAAPSFEAVVAGKLVLGAAMALSYPAIMSLFADYFAPDRRATATATIPIAQTVGAAMAVLIGGLGFSVLTEWVERDPDILWGIAPWRALLIGFAIGGLLLIPFLARLKEPQRMEAGEAQGGKLRELWAYRRFLAPLIVGIMALSGVASGVTIWIAPALMRLYGQEPGDFATWMSALALVTGLGGAYLSGQLAQRAHGRGVNMMAPAAIAAAIGTIGSFVAMMPDVLWFGIAMGIASLANAVAIAIPVIAVNYRIPNELRGLTMGLYIVLLAIVGGVMAPLVAVASDYLGGEMMLGRAMALVGVPFSLLATLCFWKAARAPGGAAPDPAPAFDHNDMTNLTGKA
ncbi:MAG: MFS transporter [Sphingopyxis sp.]|uniref:MFS transporter n=1 Tax=Sphingopyxis sp. TaxID=1908224 RepID=UPI002ABAC53C|nr:MFS transporter [Sphingopyxis sp.]MDZ3833607.1 MFS transporter [Sphingopyxis sp.]